MLLSIGLVPRGTPCYSTENAETFVTVWPVKNCLLRQNKRKTYKGRSFLLQQKLFKYVGVGDLPAPLALIEGVGPCGPLIFSYSFWCNHSWARNNIAATTWPYIFRQQKFFGLWNYSTHMFVVTILH